ncbi:MAG: hypothetical protein ACM3SS_01795 [Rhodospirillaceae bacterium]
MLHRLIAVPWYGLAALSGIAAAQPPTLTYDPPYADYRPYRDEPLAAWRAANDDLAIASSESRNTSPGAHESHRGHAQPDAKPAGQPPGVAHEKHH